MSLDDSDARIAPAEIAINQLPASNAVVFSFLTSGRIVGHLERLPDRVVFPRNDAANRCEPHRSALVAKERHNGAAERSLGRIGIATH